MMRSSSPSSTQLPTGVRNPGGGFRFFNNRSIGIRLAIGFGLLVMLTLFMAGLSYQGSRRASLAINRTKGVSAPMALAAAQAQAELLRMLGSIRGYLVLGDEQFRDEYDQAKGEFESNLAELERLAGANMSGVDRTGIDELRERYGAWQSLPEQMFELRDNTLANEPALRIQAEEAQGPITLIQVSITSMMREQADRAPSSENMTLLKDLSDFQYSFSAMVAALRGYLATLNPVFKFEYEANLAANQSAWDRLIATTGLLTPDQQADLKAIEEAREIFLPLPRRMFKAVEGTHAREDLFLLRTQAEPLTGEMLRLLDEMTLEQQQLLQADLIQGSAALNRGNWQVLSGGVIVFGLGVGLAFVFWRNITGPIIRLSEVTARIAAGEIGAQAVIEGQDEVGRLASSFNSMTQQLGWTLESLGERARALETIAEISQRLSTILNLEELLTELVHQVQENLGYYHTHIYVLDTKRERLVVAAGTGAAGAEMKAKGHSIPLAAETSLVALAARTGKVMIVDNVRETPEWLPNPLLPKTLSEGAIPISLEGKVVGVLDVQEDEIGGLDEGDASVLRSLANQVAVAIRNARLFDQVEGALAEARTAQERYLEQAWAKRRIVQQGGQYVYVRPEANSVSVAQVRQEAAGQEGVTMVKVGDNGAETTALVAPVRLRDKRIGAVQMQPAKADQKWSEDDLAVIEAVMEQLAQTAENLRLYDEARSRAGREQTIRQITERMRAATSVEELIQITACELGEHLSAGHAVVELGMEEGHEGHEGDGWR